MGGYFGITTRHDCVLDVFFGTDYHSHLGTYRGGMAAYDPEIGLQREIHSIENSPFRTKFANITSKMKGTAALGAISDMHPQPLLIRSTVGTFAISVTGIINNKEELITQYLSFSSGHFDAMTGGGVNDCELVAALITQKNSIADGIRFAQSVIHGTASILLLMDNGHLIVARDLLGRLPILVGKDDEGYAVSFESFAYLKLGYVDERELGPGEILDISPDGIRVLEPAKEEMRICSFLWSYYGYPTSTYEGVNVEVMRNKNGAIMAADEEKNGSFPKIDFVCGVPDSGTPHAIGYANESHVPFARPYIKYTPTWSRSFLPGTQTDRSRIAQMKQIAVHELIMNHDLLFVDDSIVRGTQLRETVDFLHESGAKSLHMRSACPPIMFSCKYLNFTGATKESDLIARRVIMELEGEEGYQYLEEYSDGTTERGRKLRERICEMFQFDSLEFQSLDGVIKAIGLPACKLCTYCWNGKE